MRLTLMVLWSETAAEIEENVEWIVSAEELCECCPWIAVERVRKVGTGRTEATAGAAAILQAFLTVFIIYISLRLVRKHFVRFGNQFEFLFSFRGLVLVRMVLEGELSVGLFDFIFGRTATDAKDRIVILAHLVSLEYWSNGIKSIALVESPGKVLASGE